MNKKQYFLMSLQFIQNNMKNYLNNFKIYSLTFLMRENTISPRFAHNVYCPNLSSYVLGQTVSEETLKKPLHKKNK